MKMNKLLYNRQKMLVVLLNALGGKVNNLDFQKLLFLYCMEFDPKPGYEFIPYKYGAFSFTSYADRRKLILHGVLVDTAEQWELSEVGRAFAQDYETNMSGIAQFASCYAKKRGTSLVAETYRRYPYYGVLSRIVTNVLEGDAAALERIEAARPQRGSPGIVTIGYEGRSLEAYLNVLLQDGVTLLCDVRRNALSRKYGFSKGTLSRACEGVGIRYEHIPELGIHSWQRKNLSTNESYDRLFDEYKREIIPARTGQLSSIAEWVNNGERLALTCYERHPQQCHRHCVSEALERYGRVFKARHL